ncbi:hypothetical protein P5673_012600 [Acropora cervicornis]|uniref:Uncharacterized protein n=1 Tax=Acropora cervicornis TaxID=6130 RepID=A0AAD9QNQ3_ACRCE|nr:hypothetical protein P5673_012600 [Acropora cervicornis]
MTDQLLWDVKGMKQDIAVNTTSAQKEWNTHIIKVDKDFAYIPILMAKCFRRRIEDVLWIDRHVSLSEEDPERIVPTIAHTAPISSKELFERHKTRFQKKRMT